MKIIYVVERSEVKAMKDGVRNLHLHSLVGSRHRHGEGAENTNRKQVNNGNSGYSKSSITHHLNNALQPPFHPSQANYSPKLFTIQKPPQAILHIPSIHNPAKKGLTSRCSCKCAKIPKQSTSFVPRICKFQRRYASHALALVASF